MGMSGPETCRG